MDHAVVVRHVSLVVLLCTRQKQATTPRHPVQDLELAVPLRVVVVSVVMKMLLVVRMAVRMKGHNLHSISASRSAAKREENNLARLSVANVQDGSAPHLLVKLLKLGAMRIVVCSLHQSPLLQNDNAFRAAGLDAELIKWWDVLDMWEKVDVATQLQKARECRHPDAQWLASLFPNGVAGATRHAHAIAREVMLQQGDDPRAMHLAWELGRSVPGSEALLRQAGEMGYAPAQAAMCGLTFGDESFRWAEGAWSRGNRLGMCCLARCYVDGRGCVKDRDRGVELSRTAAELGCAAARYYYACLAYGKLDWMRCHWFGLAVMRGFFLSEFPTLCFCCSRGSRMAS
jgi:TPR repeat protein